MISAGIRERGEKGGNTREGGSEEEGDRGGEKTKLENANEKERQD